MDCKTEYCKTVKLSCRVQTCIDTDTYSKLVEYQEQYGYDDMSDEQKAAFDEKLDEVVGAEGSSEEDPGDNEIEAKVLRRSR